MAPAASATEAVGRDDLSAAERYQDAILPGVSRTFALTIPQLPPPLYRAVANGYLLCRIADTIEDEEALAPPVKRRFHDRFIRVVEGNEAADPFAAELAPLLSGSTLAAERELVDHTATVVGLTHTFSTVQRAALCRCIQVMCRGMELYEEGGPAGLADVAELGRYCYYVAGCVGEMLTTLFCDYSPEIGRHQDRLATLAVSFGQGLQMTNILKDVWDDRQRGACWLPRDLFARHGVDLADLATGPEGGVDRAAFAAGMEELVGIALAHLRNAVTYVTLIPAHERGLRNFCLWAIGMALLTLRKIHHNPDFIRGAQVKITRQSVKATILTTRVAGGSNAALRGLFALLVRGLPPIPDLPPAAPVAA